MTMSSDVTGQAKKASSPKATRAKIEVRRQVFAAIGAEKAHVFDAFCGEGHMHREVWHEAASYLGCDELFYPADDRLCYAADNLRVLRTVDLAPFTVFDLDAYGSPWEQLYIIAHRRKIRPDENIGVVLTEGQGMKLKRGGMSHALSVLSGARNRLPGLARAQDEVFDRALRRAVFLMGGKIVRRWEAASKQNSTMHYIGVILQAA
jgi:hypothetical protein